MVALKGIACQIKNTLISKTIFTVFRTVLVVTVMVMYDTKLHYYCQFELSAMTKHGTYVLCTRTLYVLECLLTI